MNNIKYFRYRQNKDNKNQYIIEKASIANNIFLSFGVLSIVVALWQFQLVEIEKLSKKLNKNIIQIESIFKNERNKYLRQLQVNMHQQSYFTGIPISVSISDIHNMLLNENEQYVLEFNSEEKILHATIEVLKNENIQQKRKLDIVINLLITFLLIIMILNIVYQIRSYNKIRGQKQCR